MTLLGPLTLLILSGMSQKKSYSLFPLSLAATDGINDAA
jgi:hypothetical protein